MPGKSVQNSIVVMHELVLPNDTNVLGNILGGKVMHYMDICAAMSAYKHARSPVVTASRCSYNRRSSVFVRRHSCTYIHIMHNFST